MKLLEGPEGPEAEGYAFPELGVKTPKGIKAPDVAWISRERWAEVSDEDNAAPIPQICLEVLSPSNTDEEMEEKRSAYFEAGADEVWIVSVDGNLRFYSPDSLLEQSRLAPAFPVSIRELRL